MPHPLVAKLNLTPHTEGGWYRETLRQPSPEGERALATAILFLLDAGERSHWHRVDAAEMWLWHAGSPLTLLIGKGALLLSGDCPQGLVPAHAWQSAEARDGWALVSCVVTPGFEFAGWELAPPRLDAGGMTDSLPMPRRLLAIAALSFGSALIVIDGNIANVALPTIARDLHVDSASAVTVVTIYQLTLVMLLLPFAALGERLGLKRMYQIGQLVFTVATILCFFARSLPFLLIVRAAQAIGAAAALSVSSALIRSVYPRDQLGRGLGLNTVVVASGNALAPTLGGLVLAVAPWPWVFASAVPFALGSLLLGRALPDAPPRATPVDVLGAVMCAAMFGLVIGGAETGIHGDSPVVSAAIVMVGVAVGVFFILRERRETNPILPIDLLARPAIALSVLSSYTAFVASMTLLISFPFRMQHEFHMTPAEVGAVLAPWPLTNIIIAPTAGFLSDRIPAGVLGGIGMTITVTALCLLAFLPPDAGYFDIVWRMMLCGAGFGLFLPPNARLIVGSAPAHRAAAAGSLVSTVRQVGQTTGATLVAMLLAFGVGGGRTPPLVAAALGVVAGLCSVARLRPSLRNPKPAETADVQPAEQVR